MAIHDTDKSPGRQSPLPNSHDVAGIARMAHGTNSVNYTTDASAASTGGSILAGNARLIKSGTVRVTTPDVPAGTLILTTNSTPHGLSSAPLALAYMNNSQINGSGSFNLALPTVLSATTVAGVTEHLGFIVWMYFSTDATNFNVHVLSAGGAVGASYIVTFYLYQQPAQ